MRDDDFNVTVSRALPNTERAGRTGVPHGGVMSHDNRSRSVTWTMDARDAVDLADAIDLFYGPDDMAHEDAAALRHHALRAMSR